MKSPYNPSPREQVVIMPDERQEILQRLTRVETKLDMMNSAREMAGEALQSTKAAHHRIDELADAQSWLWRTVVAALIVGAIGLLWKGLGS